MTSPAQLLPGDDFLSKAPSTRSLFSSSILDNFDNPKSIPSLKPASYNMNIDEPLAAGFVLPGRGRKRHRQGTESTIVNRLPILKYLPRHFRSHFVAICGEFIGTFLFLFFAFSGTQVANTQTQPQTSTTIAQASNPAQLLYISLCFGFSLAVNAWVFFRISGGLFNPAVTLGMCIVGALPYIRGVLLAASQVLGAICAAAVVAVLFPGPLDVRTALRIGTSVTQGLFIEMFLTAQLVFTIFMLAAEKHKATFIAPVGIGLSLFIAELTGQVPKTSFILLYTNYFRRLLHRRLRKPSSLLRP